MKGGLQSLIRCVNLPRTVDTVKIKETSVRQKQIMDLNNLIQPKTKQKSGKIQLFDRLEQDMKIFAALYWGVSHAPQAALEFSRCAQRILVYAWLWIMRR